MVGDKLKEFLVAARDAEHDLVRVRVRVGIRVRVKVGVSVR